MNFFKKASGSPAKVSALPNGGSATQEGLALAMEDEYCGEMKHIPRSDSDTVPALSTTDKHWVPMRILETERRMPHGWGIMRFGPGHRPLRLHGGCETQHTEDLSPSAAAAARASAKQFWNGAEGYWKDGKMEGHGTYWFSNGDRYAGIFRDGKPGSKGTWWFGNGDSYQGQCGISKSKDSRGGDLMDDVTNLSREGQGIYWYHNGNRYEGQFEENQRSGDGTIWYADGGLYKGAWAKGEMEGRGKMEYANHEAYDGQWQAGTMHGRGVFFFSDGKVEFGSYVDGKRRGPAVRWNSDRSKAWQFEDGKLVSELDAAQINAGANPPPPPHGRNMAYATGLHCPHHSGTLHYPDGACYEGGLDDGVPEDDSGHARLVLASKICYEGQFASGQRHGEGREIHPDGHRYEGQFRAGAKEGEGRFWYPGGDQYYGGFKAGHRDGLGTYWFPDGAVLVSGYREGNPEGPGVWWSKDRLTAARTQDGSLLQKTTLSAATELAEDLAYPDEAEAASNDSHALTKLTLKSDAHTLRRLHYTREQRSNMFPPGEAAPLPVDPVADESTADLSILVGQEQISRYSTTDFHSLHASLATLDPRSPDTGQQQTLALPTTSDSPDSPEGIRTT